MATQTFTLVMDPKKLVEKMANDAGFTTFSAAEMEECRKHVTENGMGSLKSYLTKKLGKI